VEYGPGQGNLNCRLVSTHFQLDYPELGSGLPQWFSDFEQSAPLLSLVNTQGFLKSPASAIPASPLGCHKERPTGRTLRVREYRIHEFIVESRGRQATTYPLRRGAVPVGFE